jgi:hypothetical protein
MSDSNVGIAESGAALDVSLVLPLSDEGVSQVGGW